MSDLAEGLALAAERRFAEAEACFRRALAAAPRDPEAVQNLAAVLHRGERHAEALALADEVLATEPGHVAASLARGNALSALGRYEEAAEAYRAARRLPPEGLAGLASALAALGRDEEARQALDAAVAQAPGSAFPRFQRGLHRLSRRDFAGWDDYEARWGVERFVDESRGQVARAFLPELAVAPTAADLTGRRVLLVGEQGIGDQVMFASLVPDLVRIAARVTLVCEPRLVRLFRASFDSVEVLAPAEAQVDSDAIDKVVAMGSLAAAFRRDATDFPGTPYLAPQPQVVARWAERLGPAKGRRIGLSWRGGAATTRRAARSLPLAELAPVLALPACEFVSLQYGDVEGELAAHPQVRAFPARDIDDFEDLAGLVANLDAVVSVQTALVHLCGAMGARCLALLPSRAEWRYMAHGETMPWYGSVRLLRQSEAGRWAPVVAQAAAALR
jgi:hypothetical protein